MDDYYGKYIGSIIIGIVFLIGLLIIIDEIYNLTKFCYRYTYLYNYGKVNENTCKDEKLEFETARFKIYNEISNYKFNKDIFTKSWVSYVYYMTILILSLLLCISFGYLFKYFFIENNNSCNETNDPKQWSFLKIILRCICNDCHTYVPNCLINWIILAIIILIYPLIYLLKVIFKKDYTTENSSLTVKLFHISVFFFLIYYILVLLMEEGDNSNWDKYMKIMIYSIYIAIFYANNYFFNKKFNEYNNLINYSNNKSDYEKDDIDTTFFDLYKQEEPIKPNEIIKPPQLGIFKYCSSNDFNNSKNNYCYQINKQTIYDSNNAFFECIYKDPKKKEIINKYLLPDTKNYYEIDKLIIEEYYKQLKQYDEDMRIYNYKLNIYKNNKNEFPDIIYFLYTMCPKLTGIDKREIQLLFVLIIIVILITYYLKTIDNNNANYLYYTIFLYLLGLLSISILVNAVLTYNTYLNKYLIYEPTHNYKNSLHNKNNILNLIIKGDDNIDKNNLLNLYNLHTDKFKSDLSFETSSGLLSTSRFENNLTLDEFIIKVKNNEITLSINDNTNNPKPLLSPPKELKLINILVYKTIYSSIIRTSDLSNISKVASRNNYSIDITNKFIDTNINNYKIDNTNPYVQSMPENLTDLEITNDPNNKYINSEYIYFIKLIEVLFKPTNGIINNLKKQLKLNLEFYIYNQTTPETIDLTNINFISFIDNNNYIEKNIIRNNDDPTIKTRINYYKLNEKKIDLALDLYKEFLIKFRELIIELFNNTGISCEYSDYIDINQKLKEYIKKLFSNINNDITLYKFKDENKEEPKIGIYRRILQLMMGKINDLFNKYLNLMKIYIKSFEISSGNLGGIIETFTSSSTSTSTSTSTISRDKMINKLINNYNIFNLDTEKHIGDDLKKIYFRINDSNYSKSKYDNFDTIDLKKLKISTDNVSWSFIILIIIFAIILIEPTII